MDSLPSTEEKLVVLQQIVGEIYWPVLYATIGEDKVTDTLRNEFLASIL